MFNTLSRPAPKAHVESEERLNRELSGAVKKAQLPFVLVSTMTFFRLRWLTPKLRMPPTLPALVAELLTMVVLSRLAVTEIVDADAA
jgi:hypothetical protein